jgi:hypothetical protein
MKTSHSRSPEQNERWTKALFSRLGAIYGHKFASAYPQELIEVAIGEWGAAIMPLGGYEISSALELLRSSDSPYPNWPPTLPEFVSLAKPGASFPSSLEAYNSMVRREVSHPLVMEACCHVDIYNVRLMPEREAMRIFRSAYSDVCDKCKKIIHEATKEVCREEMPKLQ